MPREEQYQVSWEDGTLRIVMAYSNKGAARAFCVKYGVPTGGRFRVKKRGDSEWVSYTRTKNGLRTLSD
jgi:hypothetical protein